MKSPPSRSRNLFSDIHNFLFITPPVSTLASPATKEERIELNQRIMQRVGIRPQGFTVLNIHKIGIETPVSYVFDELSEWNGDSTCWPNHIARVVRVNGNLEEISINLFSIKRLRLFYMNAIRIRKVPAETDDDNARYLLYKCSGGYPIGIFSMFVRSSIESMNEKGTTQLFMVVGFNFFDNNLLSRIPLIRKPWEYIHNRVTNNVMNRFKQLCEWRFEKIQNNN